MDDTTRQTAAGQVLWQFTWSLDGFVAGPKHSMDRMAGFSLGGVGALGAEPGRMQAS